MDATALLALLVTCAPQVHPVTGAAIVAAESSRNPFAIGVVGGQLERQPKGLDEALVTADALRASGWIYSLGLAQINTTNFARLGLDHRAAFDPCRNLAAMQSVLLDCLPAGASWSQAALRRSLSCYYSGNPTTGFEHGYVQRVVRLARPPPDAAQVDPAATDPSSKPTHAITTRGDTP